MSEQSVVWLVEKSIRRDFIIFGVYTTQQVAQEAVEAKVGHSLTWELLAGGQVCFRAWPYIMTKLEVRSASTSELD